MVCRFSGLLSVPPTCIQVKRLVPAVSCNILRASHSVWHVIGAQEISEWIAIQVREQIMSAMILLSMSAICSAEGDGTPLQCSCLENPKDWGAWWAAIHGVAQSWTWLSDFTFTCHFPALEKEMATHSSVLAWRVPGTGSLVGCRLWGRTESDTTERLSSSSSYMQW